MAKFIYHRNKEDTVNENKVQTEEFLRDGPKGLTFRFMHLDKKKNHYKKIVGKLADDGKSLNIGVKEEGKDLVTMDIKVADLKKHKELKFVVDYIAKDMAKFRKSMKAGKRRKSSRKKSRKKTSKKKKSRRKTSRRKTSRRRKR